MDTNVALINFLAVNAVAVTAALGFIILLLLILVIYLFSTCSGLKARYNAMMKGEQTGTSFEKMMLDHISQTQEVKHATEQLDAKLKEVDALLQTAVTRVGIVRFCAFDNMGGDLSYAVALLDSYNNGVVFSSIFARADSRSYVKPIVDGKSTYTLTKEEDEAMKKAIASAKK